ncbi:hypothetical protein P8452_22114 [Trifolium repens]|nr:hypothetical protein P8452_22114 [Trifolium repens]
MFIVYHPQSTLSSSSLLPPQTIAQAKMVSFTAVSLTSANGKQRSAIFLQNRISLESVDFASSSQIRRLKNNIITDSQIERVIRDSQILILEEDLILDVVDFGD